MKKFLIIDGNSIMNRAFYGIKLLTNSEGLYTNAVYGFLNILFKNIDAINPDYIAVAFDLKAPTFRHKRYAEYKAQRKGMPEELFMQMPIIKEVLSAMNIVILEKEGYEADDIIGTMAKRCEDSGIECDIVTGDKDDLQLASKTTKVYLTVTSKGQTTTDIYDEDAVYAKYGVTPKEFIDVKGLMGDTSDNIPGVSGIGEKTAFALIGEYKSIDAVYENLETAKLGPSAKQKLKDGKDMAYLSKELATIDINSPIEETVDECAVSKYNNEALLSLFTRLEFKSFIERCKVETVSEKNLISAKEITDESELKGLLSDIDEFCYYLFKRDGSPCAIAFLKGDEVYYSEFSVSAYKDVFENENIPKISHGIKEDIVILNKLNVEYKAYAFDAEIGAYILDPTASDYKLSRLSMAYLSRLTEDFEDKKSVLINDNERKLELSADAVMAVRDLRKTLLEKIKENGQEFLLYEVELPLISVLADMEITGFTVDAKMLEAYGKELELRIKSLEDSIYFMAGEEFNINSPKQLGTVLFEHLSLPVIKKTKTGYSTDAEVLSELSGKYPIVESILEYRQMAKLKGTYVDGMLPLIGEDGKIHSTFNQTVTATGRISSAEPNLQNIPVRMEEGRRLRKMFTADSENEILIDADYSQIELRVLSHLSGDEAMQKAFLDGTDIHKRCASEIFGVPEDEVTESMRRRAKAVNFGIVYGISEFGLAKDIHVTRAEAKRYMEAYFATYPKIKAFMDNTVAEAKVDGIVKTMFGRRRYIPEILSGNFNTRSFGERAAMNTPVQGTAADIIKIAMVRVSKALSEETEKCRLILQVHDELIVSAPVNEADKAEEILVREMENAAKIAVPLLADAGRGFSWYDAK